MENKSRDDILVEWFTDKARIMDRIVLQNTHSDIADDFKFFEDESDEFRENGEGNIFKKIQKN